MHLSMRCASAVSTSSNSVRPWRIRWRIPRHGPGCWTGASARWMTPAPMRSCAPGWTEMPETQLAAYLIGGIARAELPFVPQALFARTRAAHEFLLPPLPNQLFTRDTSCWVGKGVFVNPMHWPARRLEAANAAAVYRFHPRFKGTKFHTLFRRRARSLWQYLSLEGGDVMPLGNGVVLIGMGERSTPQAVTAICAPPVRTRCRHARHRRADAARSLLHASRHRLLFLRPRSRHHLPGCRRTG